MQILFGRFTRRHRASRRTDGSLKAAARRELRSLARQVRHGGAYPARSAALLSEISRLRVELQDLAAYLPDDDALGNWLEQVSFSLADDIYRHRHPADDPTVRRHMSALLSRMADVHSRLNATQANGTLQNHVTVCTSLLAEVVNRLMPPERMAVIAGRSSAGGLMLTGCFDVTHRLSASAVHVRADPERLGQALTAMDATGTKLAAWVHSHPGGGPGATLPSPIDRQQYAEWVKDYGALLGIIVTADRHVRFWGGVESGHLEVRLQGVGAEKVNEYVYRLAGQPV